VQFALALGHEVCGGLAARDLITRTSHYESFTMSGRGL
jgi:hypothetical protein